MLAMAHVLMQPGVDTYHQGLLSQLGVPKEVERELLRFLRTQGLASYLGFRRTWPAPRSEAALDGIPDERDAAFSRMVNKHNLLLSKMDRLTVWSSALVHPDAWGGTSSNPVLRGIPRWPVGNGTLFDFPKGPGRGTVCDDSAHILQGWLEQAKSRNNA